MKFSIDRWQKLAGVSLLRESEEKEARLRASIEGYAVGEFRDEDGITIIIYDPKAMKDAIDSMEEHFITYQRPSQKVIDSIQGMTRITPPGYGTTKDRNSCHGAWEVIRIAVRNKGKGMGSMLYKLALAASPTGKIMPDRLNSSEEDRKKWKSMFDKMSKEKKRENVFDEDNCDVYKGDDEGGPGSNFMNYAYDDMGGEVNVDDPKKRHEDFMKEITSAKSKIRGFNFAEFFWFAASDMFHKIYGI